MSAELLYLIIQSRLHLVNFMIEHCSIRCFRRGKSTCLWLDPGPNGEYTRAHPELAFGCENRDKNLPLTPAPAPQPIQPIPREQWPVDIRFYATMQQPGDAGVGDTVHRELGVPGRVIEGLTWGLCGCAQRRAEWNQKYVYSGCADAPPGI